ncbi:MAG TPA: DUF92 domain-containing protein [Gemmatimonadales bacterium]|nr:DUF92 domain-containing protein [Gemmatimonadales bacterium]
MAAAVSAAVAGLAWLARGLTGMGAAAACVVGTLVLFGSGWSGGAVLAAFFVSGTLVSRIARPPALLDPKGHRRDARQVLANGGVAAGLALFGRQDPALALWLVTGALAAASADTWATSIGSRSRTVPRRVVGWAPVPAGTSGGVTPAGSAGALAGAAIVALTGAVAAGSPPLFPAATLVGFLGMAIDSALGATLQARYRCAACGVPSEWPVHRCGAATVHEGGIAWLDNDGVNLAATAAAAALALAAWACC